MKNKLVSLKNKMTNRKGFTLVELIIVMVIIAILAVALIPSMMGYITDARRTANTSTARSYYTAAQSVASFATANGTIAVNGDDWDDNDADAQWDRLTEGLPGNVVITLDGTIAGQVATVTYNAPSGPNVLITYSAGRGIVITYP